MKLPAFNGSPLKKWNTSQLLLRALRGAESERAKTKLDYLHDLDFKGCTSCFACKWTRGKSYGHCAVNDDLQPIFEKIENADGILIESPIYLGIKNGVTRCFLEYGSSTRTLSTMRNYPHGLRKRSRLHSSTSPGQRMSW